MIINQHGRGGGGSADRTDCARGQRTVHDLRNATNMLMGTLEVLSAEGAGPLAPEQSRLLERMGARVRRMSELLDDLEHEDGRAEQQVLPLLSGDPVSGSGVGVESTTAAMESGDADGPLVSNVSVVPSPGDRVDGIYCIEEIIGEGGMGTVFRARDVQLERDVALKLVTGTAWPSEAARQSFLDEARTLARVRHPNVVAVHALGSFAGNPYFVMELVEGTNLRRLLRARGEPLGLDEALAMLDQLCRGVAAINRAGTVHRDLKPSNILIGPAFRVAIADLGLALPLGRSTGEMLRGGTPGYTAPEVFSEREVAFTERVDVYGLGALAYACLTGEPPFRGRSAASIVRRQERGDFARPDEVRHDFPSDLADVICGCLSPSPDDRPENAAKLRSSLLERLSREASYQGRRIDVVDDDDDVRDAMAQLVRQLLPGAEVRAFGDGSEGAAAMIEQPPDLLIVDLDMPQMNGVELTALVRSEPRTADVRVLVITGVGSGRDWELLKSIGADAFLVKPVDAESLGALARNLLGEPEDPDDAAA